MVPRGGGRVTGSHESALTDGAGDDLGVRLGRWFELVRRARIGRERKAAAMMFGSYAEADGTAIHCGTARFALDCEVSYATARRYLAWMREVGLVERVKSGNKRKGLSDEYRLILGADLLEHLDVPDPAQYRKMADEIKTANREGSARRSRMVRQSRRGPEPEDLRSPKTSADRMATDRPESHESALTQTSAERGPETVLRSPKVGAENSDLRSSEPRSALTLDEHPPTRNTYPQLHTYPPSGKDLRTDVAVTRARASEDRDFSPPHEDPKPPESSALSAPSAPPPRRYPQLRRPNPGCGARGCAGGFIVVGERLDYCPQCYDLGPAPTNPQESP